MEYMAQKADEQIEGAILEQLRQRIDELEAEKAEREAQEPAAWAWNDALGCMRVHCGPRRPEWVDRECSEATRAEMSLRPLYAAPPVPRVDTDWLSNVMMPEFLAALDAANDNDLPDGAWWHMLEDAADEFMREHHLRGCRNSATHQWIDARGSAK
jgi:hypothetical protein